MRFCTYTVFMCTLWIKNVFVTKHTQLHTQRHKLIYTEVYYVLVTNFWFEFLTLQLRIVAPIIRLWYWDVSTNISIHQESYTKILSTMQLVVQCSIYGISWLESWRVWLQTRWRCKFDTTDNGKQHATRIFSHPMQVQKMCSWK